MGVSIFGGFNFLNGSVNSAFDKIFDEKFTETHPTCYGRVEFKTAVRELLGRPNPSGIIFVTGPKNAGKTTAIKSALVGRDHVTYINLREKKFTSEETLVKSLKDCFNLRSFQDFMKNFNLGYLGSIFNMFSSFGTMFGSSDDFKALDEILAELEKILKYAYHKRGSGKISARPVIFVDEIGNLQPMVNGNEHQKACVKKFINWIIKVTKDMMLCDVIFASHDGFAMETLSLSDPLYTVPLTMPDYTESELKAIVKENKELSDKFIPNILKDIGSQGALVIDALKIDSKLRFDRYCAMLGFKERETISEILHSAKTQWYMHPYTAWGDYSESDFACFMDKFVEKRTKGKELKISFGILTTTCLPQVIKYFSNQGWLLYDPSMQQVSVRNKIFLDAYEYRKDKEKNIDSLVKQIGDMNSLCFGFNEDPLRKDCDKSMLASMEDDLEKAYNSPK